MRTSWPRRLGALAALVPVVALPVVSGVGWGATTTYTKVIERVHLVDGKDVVADRRTFRLTVGTTTGLRDRQGIEVSWSGALPTRFPVGDPSSLAARNQEHPVVLLQCRGVDTTSVPAAQRLSPETCWTQTNGERFLMSPGVAFPPWRVDRYAAVADRAEVAGAPSPLPKGCSPTGYTERWLPFVAASGHVYPGGLAGCAGVPPESTNIDSTLGQPGNTTYAATGSDGRGSARFVVWTSQSNASLGCSDTVRCSLVVVPVEGVSCDVAALGLPEAERPTGDDATQADQVCRAEGGTTLPDVTVTGGLWWTPSNWRNRVTVPLSFARLPGDCGGSSGSPGIAVYGSELLGQATQSWGSAFCRDPKLFPFRHVQTGEPQARTILSNGSVDAAFTSFPPAAGWPKPVTQVPVGLTGFAIGYTVDDEQGHPYHQLRLNARLLAKLLTQSYPAVQAVQAGHSLPPTKADPTPPLDLAHNPLDMSLDPEFQQLNPGIKHGVYAGPSAATLLSLSSDSDVIRAVTSYVQADPQARAWLDGTPDPWGMTVNAFYKGISLPTDSWPLLDSYEPRSIYNETNPCLQANPVPYLPLVAAPQARMPSISLDLQYALSPLQLKCDTSATGTEVGAKLVALGRQDIGARFLVGITSLADARRYQIDTAALQTRPGTFVAPTSASLRAGADLLVPHEDQGTWLLPYDKVAGPTASAAAYPGTMLVSAAVPTSGLDPATAGRYATALRWLTTTGQLPGTGDGRLPDGYLPLTAGNGLGAMVAFAGRAADAVQAQAGAVPTLAAPAVASPGATPVPGTAPGPGPMTAVPAPTSAVPQAVPAVQPAVLRQPVLAAPAAAAVATASPAVGAVAAVLPVLVGVALATGTGYVGVTVLGRRAG